MKAEATKHNTPIRPSKAVIKKVQSIKSHKGEIAVIDPETGQYFLGKTMVEAIKKARTRFPDRIFYAVRIGSKALYEHKGIGSAK